MKTEIEFKGLKSSVTLSQQVNREIDKIAKKFDWVEHTIIYLVKDNGIDSSCVCELEVRSGTTPNIFIKESNGKFEVAIAKAFDVLERQLRKAKNKVVH